VFSRVSQAIKAFQERRFVIIFSENENEADLAIPAQEIVAESVLARPGHVALLGAHPDGIIGRNGHTEAIVELCRLAGLYPGGVLCELVSDSGDMMNAKELKTIAEKFHIPIITIGALSKFARSFIKKVEKT